MGLDLYAKIEPFLGFEEQRYQLYEIFLEKLKLFGPKRILDIGCGSGTFMSLAQKAGFEIIGIDLSQEMVQRAQAQGLECFCTDVCDFDQQFDAAVALFDVLNYISPSQIDHFLNCVAKRLKDGGYFLADINTLYGFEEIAQGALWIDKGDFFIALDATFEQNRLQTDIVYFNKEKECYKKEKDTIIQYYHDVSILKRVELQIIDIDFIELFGEQPDKALLLFQKV